MSTGEHEERVRAHLQPGEVFRAAVWVSRADEQPPMEITRSELSPLRFRRRPRDMPYRPPVELAAGLEEHVRLVSEPRILAITDRRLLVLAKRAFSSALRVRWECPRDRLTAAAEEGGRLRLDFADGSTLTLLTPSAQVRPFLDQV
ncbi:hypothetical protein AMIS_32950 [Actinoplanes missouriensis 431]|uniref:Uncharacterized protein n=1 Tax=Actinoplanes missouriensis (strain ATCC 14538 / DSM 43046 / CBS 188.64 / JCM 3121 / NBRC 102363 / NCIMB 12654 / NRRL B-3342 / UNCC 431) TaxID=512565 RepID=I0H678_ACTM4|nr:hypothetical protein [Actinoplanes missouriensis]BAL88515.1 hypothetical protein AMIS_32950 [Actinoplanes missouriensis 431]